jgi:hypothetical protein
MPTKPAVFDAHGAPVGVEIRFVTFTATRPVIKGSPRLQLVHTNAASREGNIAASWNWAHAKPGSNTLPHYQVDRNGAARKMLPTNRVGIANCTSPPKAQVRNWSLAYETADRGTLHPDGLGGFTPAQGETLAQILAYEAITHGIPLEYPDAWDGAGTACHTEPYYWSCVVGKNCPGADKKRDMREWIIPRAREIRTEWTAPPTPVPPPSIPGDDDMVTGLWKGPNDPAVFAVCSNRTKVWCYPDTVDEHQKLLVLEGTDETIRVQESAEMFRAMGPVIGPRPGTVDEYGWR